MQLLIKYVVMTQGAMVGKSVKLQGSLHPVSSWARCVINVTSLQFTVIYTAHPDTSVAVRALLGLSFANVYPNL